MGLAPVQTGRGKKAHFSSFAPVERDKTSFSLIFHTDTLENDCINGQNASYSSPGFDNNGANSKSGPRVPRPKNGDITSVNQNIRGRRSHSRETRR
jgi:hypothetical protein